MGIGSGNDTEASRAGDSLPDLTITPRDDGNFAVRGPVGTRRFVVSVVEKELLEEWAAVQDAAEALHRYHQRRQVAAFNEMLSLREKLREAGVVDGKPRRGGLVWNVPFPAVVVWILAVAGITSMVYACWSLSAHEAELFRKPERLASQFLLALFYCALTSTLCEIVRASMFVGRGLGPQALFFTTRGGLPRLDGDESEALGLSMMDRRLVQLSCIFENALPAGVLAAAGQYDAAFFAGATWLLLLSPLREGPLPALLGEWSGLHDLLGHLRQYHKRLLGRQQRFHGERGLLAFLVLVLLWVGSLLWLANFTVDHWPPITNFSLDTREGLAGVLLTLFLAVTVLVVTVRSLGYLARLLLESLAPVTPLPHRRVAAVRTGAGSAWEGARQSPLLLLLSDDELRALLEQATVQEVAPGGRLGRRNEDRDFLFVILQGEATTLREHASGLEEATGERGAGEWIGEVEPSAEGAPAVRARTPLKVLCIPLPALRALLEPDGRWARLEDVARTARVLGQNELLRRASPATIHRLSTALRHEVAQSGEPVVREGEPGERFYLIEQGRVEVTAGGTVLKQLQAGDFFGEIALLSDSPRIATVTPVEETRLLSLSREDFWRVLSEDPHLGALLEAVGARRLRG